METQKIVSLLNSPDNYNARFATKKWYIIDIESDGNYSKDEEIKFLTRSIESSLCNYSDAYILVTGNITTTPNTASTQVIFKNCARFEKYRTGRNFYDQPINDSIKQYDEIRKISTGQGDDYTTGCLLDFAYFEKNYRLIAADLSKQKALDADSRAIQQIIFTGKIKATVANTRVIIFYILEK